MLHTLLLLFFLNSPIWAMQASKQLDHTIATLDHNDDTQECSICTCPLTEECAARYWHCNHGKAIHKDCAEKIFLSTSAQCPLCRSEPKKTIYAKVLSHHRGILRKRMQFIRAFMRCDGKTLHRLLQQDINFSTPDKQGTSILLEIARCRPLNAVQFALDFGGKKILKESNYKGNTILHAATFNNDSNVLKMLLQTEASSLICTPNDNGIHPLHGAAYQGRSDLITMLLLNGAQASLQACDERGFKPIDYAYLSGNCDSIMLLQQAM